MDSVSEPFEDDQFWEWLAAGQAGNISFAPDSGAEAVLNQGSREQWPLQGTIESRFNAASNMEHTGSGSQLTLQNLVLNQNIQTQQHLVGAACNSPVAATTVAENFHANSAFNGSGSQLDQQNLVLNQNIQTQQHLVGAACSSSIASTAAEFFHANLDFNGSRSQFLLQNPALNQNIQNQQHLLGVAHNSYIATTTKDNNTLSGNQLLSQNAVPNQNSKNQWPLLGATENIFAASSRKVNKDGPKTESKDQRHRRRKRERENENARQLESLRNQNCQLQNENKRLKRVAEMLQNFQKQRILVLKLKFPNGKFDSRAVDIVRDLKVEGVKSRMTREILTLIGDVTIERLEDKLKHICEIEFLSQDVGTSRIHFKDNSPEYMEARRPENQYYDNSRNYCN